MKIFIKSYLIYQYIYLKLYILLFIVLKILHYFTYFICIFVIIKILKRILFCFVVVVEMFTLGINNIVGLFLHLKLKFIRSNPHVVFSLMNFSQSSLASFSPMLESHKELNGFIMSICPKHYLVCAAQVIAHLPNFHLRYWAHLAQKNFH